MLCPPGVAAMGGLREASTVAGGGALMADRPGFQDKRVA